MARNSKRLGGYESLVENRRPQLDPPTNASRYDLNRRQGIIGGPPAAYGLPPNIATDDALAELLRMNLRDASD